MHVAVLCCIHNSELSMHDVGQIILSLADITLVACASSYCALDPAAELLCMHNMELGTHDTER